MAADTANGGLGQLERHYQTFIVGHIYFFALVVLLKTAYDVLDRTRFCRDCWCRSELRSHSIRMVGYRNAG